MADPLYWQGPHVVAIAAFSLQVIVSFLLFVTFSLSSFDSFPQNPAGTQYMVLKPFAAFAIVSLSFSIVLDYLSRKEP